nr:helix-turn-helix transcriptional regulator [Brucella intermedia]
MKKTIWSEGHNALVKLIREKRRDAGLTQEDVARALEQRQNWVSHLESNGRRIDVVEYVRLAEIIGFDAADELRKLIPVIIGK